MDALGAEVIPSPTATGDFTRRTINAVQARAVAGPGAGSAAPVSHINLDEKLALTSGDKKAGMERSHQRVWGSRLQDARFAKEVRVFRLPWCPWPSDLTSPYARA